MFWISWFDSFACGPEEPRGRFSRTTWESRLGFHAASSHLWNSPGKCLFVFSNYFGSKPRNLRSWRAIRARIRSFNPVDWAVAACVAVRDATWFFTAIVLGSRTRDRSPNDVTHVFVLAVGFPRFAQLAMRARAG